MKFREPRIKSDAYLDFIRQLPCVVCGNDVETQAAHIRYSEPLAGKYKAGVGQKSHDLFAVPLCNRCHMQDQHSGNERQFWEGYGIDPVYLSLALNRVAGDHAAACGIIQAHRDQATVTPG